jgi:hypothetical protein
VVGVARVLSCRASLTVGTKYQVPNLARYYSWRASLRLKIVSHPTSSPLVADDNVTVALPQSAAWTVADQGEAVGQRRTGSESRQREQVAIVEIGSRSLLMPVQSKKPSPNVKIQAISY